MSETIVALSSGRLPSGVAVIRISGPRSRFAVETMAGFIPAPRHATLANLRGQDGSLIDSGLILFFPGPHSFTGEDVAEFQVHGGAAVVAALLRETVKLGIRMAEPGEFTRQAFLNGRMDLTQAEALADLISAETEAQRRMALRNTDGAQRELYADWGRRLTHARAMLEAELDFSDEGDVPGSVAAESLRALNDLASEIERHIDEFRKAEIVREGLDVVILGAPNAGKSSLINALARRDVAIVSDEPGTTRDLIEVSLDLEGYKVRVTDTAGLRTDAGKVEALGIQKARERAEQADVVLLLEDMVEPIVAAEVAGPRWVRVGTKVDKLGIVQRASARTRYDIVISSNSGDGLEELLALLFAYADESVGSFDVLPSRIRHVDLLRQTARYLREALAEDNGVELRAEQLRLAGASLGRISGAVDVEDMLDVIFSQFCIGK